MDDGPSQLKEKNNWYIIRKENYDFAIKRAQKNLKQLEAQLQE